MDWIGFYKLARLALPRRRRWSASASGCSPSRAGSGSRRPRGACWRTTTAAGAARMTTRSREIAERPRRRRAERDGIGEDDNAIPLWFNLGFDGTIVVGVLYILYYTLSGWSQRASTPPSARARSSARPPRARLRRRRDARIPTAATPPPSRRASRCSRRSARPATSRTAAAWSARASSIRTGSTATTTPSCSRPSRRAGPAACRPGARSSAPRRSGRCSPTSRRCRAPPSRASARPTTSRRAAGAAPGRLGEPADARRAPRRGPLPPAALRGGRGC